MLQRISACVLACSLGLLADTLVLRNGTSVEGTYLGGDSRRVRIAVEESVQSYDVNEITEIRFGPAKAAASAPAPAPAPAPQTKRAERIELLRPQPSAPASASRPPVEIPVGTALVVRMIDDVDSERNQTGQTFRASMDEAVVVDSNTVIPRGADVTVKLIEDKQSGKLTGRTELTLDIVSVTIDGREVDVATQAVTQASESRTTQSAQRAGGGAAIGAVIGAIAGGGRGAAIGAATGAAAGGAVQVMTKGQRVRIPSETRLTFTLQQAIRI
jgi:hypothetical protein